MRIEVDNDKVRQAQRAYKGPETSAKSLVEWLLREFGSGNISSIQAMQRSWPQGGTRPEEIAKEEK